MENAVKALFRPFETGDVQPPTPGSEWAFIGAMAHPAAHQLFAGAHLQCEQPFRPDYLALQKAGFSVTPALPDRACDGALVLLGKHRRLNEANIARANRIVRPGGMVLVAGDKKLGGVSARSWTSGRVALDGHLSKHHAVVFWFAADAEAFGDVELPILEPAPGCHARPGMFSADRVDTGSALLARFIDTRITGAVADFGSGWGYLSAQLLRHAKPGSLDLFEADKASLDQAMENLAALAGDIELTGHWHDLTLEAPPKRYDWIIMNPPFHAGRASQPDLGQRFIQTASDSLKPHGHLLMVANQRLPYEQVLTSCFGSVRTLEESEGFKVIEARGPRSR